MSLDTYKLPLYFLAKVKVKKESNMHKKMISYESLFLLWFLILGQK